VELIQMDKPEYRLYKNSNTSNKKFV